MWQYTQQLVRHMNRKLETSGLTPTLCRTLEAKSLLFAAKHDVYDKITTYNVRFSLVTPRAEPMEMLAVFWVGKLDMRGLHVDTIMQTSRFSHWTNQCIDAVRASDGNPHYCDCVRPPKGGWNATLNRNVA
jgi:hypothetical protein